MPTEFPNTRWNVAQGDEVVEDLFEDLRRAIYNRHAINQWASSADNAQLELPFRGTWSSTITYRTNHIVTLSDVRYRSLKVDNLNKNPATEPTWWEKTTYDSSTTYDADALVWYSGVYWRSKVINNLNHTPAKGSAYWYIFGLWDRYDSFHYNSNRERLTCDPDYTRIGAWRYLPIQVKRIHHPYSSEYVDEWEMDATNSAFLVYGSLYWKAQTFTPQISHTVTKLKLRLAKNSTPSGNFTAAIRNVDSGGEPTGANLCSGSIACSTISTDFAWYEISLGEGIALEAGTTYAIVCSAPDATAGTPCYWAVNHVDANYSRGNGFSSVGSGGEDWFSRTTWDYNFEEWGTIRYEYYDKMSYEKGGIVNCDDDLIITWSYECIKDHIAMTTNKPGVGAGWETYWKKTGIPVRVRGRKAGGKDYRWNASNITTQFISSNVGAKRGPGAEYPESSYIDEPSSPWFEDFTYDISWFEYQAAIERCCEEWGWYWHDYNLLDLETPSDPWRLMNGPWFDGDPWYSNCSAFELALYLIDGGDEGGAGSRTRFDWYLDTVYQHKPYQQATIYGTWRRIWRNTMSPPRTTARQWRKNIDYSSDDGGDTVYVYDNEAGNGKAARRYKCILSHTSTDDNQPPTDGTNNTWWEYVGWENHYLIYPGELGLPPGHRAKGDGSWTGGSGGAIDWTDVDAVAALEASLHPQANGDPGSNELSTENKQKVIDRHCWRDYHANPPAALLNDMKDVLLMLRYRGFTPGWKFYNKSGNCSDEGVFTSFADACSNGQEGCLTAYGAASFIWRVGETWWTIGGGKSSYVGAVYDPIDERVEYTPDTGGEIPTYCWIMSSNKLEIILPNSILDCFADFVRNIETVMRKQGLDYANTLECNPIGTAHNLWKADDPTYKIWSKSGFEVDIVIDNDDTAIYYEPITIPVDIEAYTDTIITVYAELENILIKDDPPNVEAICGPLGPPDDDGKGHRAKIGHFDIMDTSWILPLDIDCDEIPINHSME